eukprot:5062054-Prymnesium_polylepis.1
MVRCEVPPLNSQYAGTLPVAAHLLLSLNGQQYTIGPANFTFFEADTIILELSPLIGTIRGGTHVVLRGSGFLGGDSYACRFGESAAGVVQATVRADGGIACMTPEAAVAEETQVYLTLNGIFYNYNTSIKFTYTLSESPQTLTPTSGPRYGGTTVAFGMLQRPASHKELANGLALCRFGNYTVPGTFSSAGFLTCVTPAHPMAAVDVFLSINGQ